MKRYNIVKKVPILLLAGMLTISAASWTVYAEGAENAVLPGDNQDGDAPQVQSKPGNTEGTDSTEGTEGGVPDSGGTINDGGTGTGSQETDNGGAKVIPQGGEDNGGTDVDS